MDTVTLTGCRKNEVSFDGRFVTIKCDKFGHKSQTKLPVRSIVAVDVVTASAFAKALRFRTAATGEWKKRNNTSHRLDAMDDPNAVMFKRGQRKDFEAFADLVREAIADAA